VGETKASLALALSEEIIDNLELSSIPLASICMKASRLARLLDDSTRQKYLTQAATYVNSKESEVETFKTQLSVANDPNISLSSSNPQQYLIEPTGNALERTQLTLGIGDRET